MESEKKILFNTFYQMAGKIVISAFGVINVFFLTHYLKEIGFSEYSFIFSFVGLASIFIDFGLGTLLIRDIASKKESEDHFSNIFTLRILLSCIILFSSFIIMFFLPYTNIVKIGIFIAFFSNIVSLLSSLIWSVFQAELIFKKIVIAQVGISIVNLILIILGVVLKLNLLYFVLVSLLSNIVGFFISSKLINYKKYLTIVKINDIKKIIKDTLPFAFGVIVSVAYFKVDSIILSFYYNPSYKSDVGLYALSYKLFEVVIVFGGYFTQTLFPYFSGIKDKKTFKSNFRKYLLYSILISITASIGLYIFSRPLVSILGGEKFISSYHSVEILSLAAGTTILSGFFLSVALAKYKEMMLLKFSILALLINVILNLIFIPKYSYIGASWITVITQLFILVANGFAAFQVVKQYKS